MLMLVVWLNYGIPSLALILFFLRFLRRSEFKYSFYRVIQCDLVMNVFCYLNTWIQRLCQVEETAPAMVWVFENASFIFPINAFFSHFFWNAQAMSVIILSVHRLSSSVSASGNEFWNKFFIHVYAVVIVLSAGITASVQLAGLFTPLTYYPSTGKFQSAPSDPEKRMIYSLVFSIEMWTYFTVISAVNLCTIFSVRKRFRSTFASPKTKKMMRSLTLIAFINTIVFLCVILWQPFYSKIIQIDRTINNYLMMIMSDALSLSMPYILLILDQNVRTTVVRMLGSYLEVNSATRKNSVSQRTRSVALI